MSYCSLQNCNQEEYSKGFCHRHYIRYKKYGDPLFTKILVPDVPRVINKHGYKIRAVYAQMKQRCYNQNCSAYKDYGARGITVCDSWLESIDNFVEDMGTCPKGYSLDRKDNDGNYEPSNCRWTTSTIQKWNRRKFRSNKSGHRGVHWDKARKRWVAEIGCNYKIKNLGGFVKLEEAVEARKQAELLYWKP